MLDIKFIRENPEKVKKSLLNRGIDFNLAYLIEVDEKRRAQIKTVDDLRAKQNELVEEIAELSGEKRTQKIDIAKKLKQDLSALETDLKNIENEFLSLMYKIPNLPLDDVPVGRDESSNQVLRQWGKLPEFDFKPKDHTTLGHELGIIDKETATRVAGARFTYLKGSLVLLQYALVQFAFDILNSPRHLKKVADSIAKNYPAHTFTPIVVPLMIKPDVYTKTARLSEGVKDERYKFAADDLYLVGSGEHTLVPMHMGEILDEERLPLRYVTYSSCFRREAGSYGKDTQGILRLHQFDKVEMESFSAKEMALKEHGFFIALQEHIMQLLKLPHRVVLSSTGDTDEPCAHHVDIETWMPGENKYRETHSADFTGDYQTRRLNTRIRRKNGSIELAYANDATVIAIGRTLVALMENYQQKNGSIKIPKILKPYLGGMKEIK